RVGGQRPVERGLASAVGSVAEPHKASSEHVHREGLAPPTQTTRPAEPAAPATPGPSPQPRRRVVAVATLTSALGVVQTWISTKVGQQLMHGLRTSVFGHL